MKCEYCGRTLQEEDIQCPGCGAAVLVQEAPQIPVEENHVESTSKPPQEEVQIDYAGFWRRVAATIIDGILMMMLTATGIGVLVTFIYEPLCETYWDGATIGKKVVGIKVVNTHLEKITIWQGFGRYFGKILCVMTLYIGFIMVAFSSKKQGLHDKLAGTYVINSRG